MSEADLQLLDRYARDRAEDAFAELVRRHLDLVYSAALRQVRSPQLAEEVAQSVFTDLARAAHRLAPDTVLAAWLYQVTRRTAVDVVRREVRRQLREQIATEMNVPPAPVSDWTRIEALLDDAMSALDETDRTAILLRYFENKSLREVGQMLGTSDDAAQKRVSRAVERLREFFTKQGITVGAGGLTALIASNAVQAAPTGLAALVSTATLSAGTAITAVTTATATKVVAMTTLQKSLVTAALALLAGAGLYEARRASLVEQQLRLLQQRDVALLEQTNRLGFGRNASPASLVLEQENERLRRNNEDLLRLRAEVARLRGIVGKSAGDTAESTIRTWTDRVALLKRKLEQMPDKRIPEMQFLTEKHWVRAAQDADVESDDGIRDALGDLRTIAKTVFAAALQSALKQYTNANNGLLPDSLTQLTPYFVMPVDSTILNRYELLQTGRPSDDPSKAIVQEMAPPVDDLHDSQIGIGLNLLSTDRFNGITDVIEMAAKAFATANDGRAPTLPSELTPYLRLSVDESVLRDYLDQHRVGVGGVGR
jgi:RNA polymerase sigma factor (sigma-70 family)